MVLGNDLRRRILVDRAVSAVGSKWEYFGRIADMRGFADRAASTLDELDRAGFDGKLKGTKGRIADVVRLVASFRKLDPPPPDEVSDETDPGPNSRTPSAECIEAPGVVGEARLVARRIRSLMADGVSPDAIVVTARDVEASADVFAEVFDEYAVTVRGFPAPPLARAPAVAFLLRAWRVPAGGYTFADVAELLRSTFFRPPGWGGDLAMKAEALLRRVGGPEGREAFLKSAERWAVDPPAPMTDEGPAATRRAWTVSLAVSCHTFLPAVFRLWDDLPAKTKPSEWVEQFRQFARGSGVDPAPHPDDAAALASLYESLAVWVDALPAKALSAADFSTALTTVTTAAASPASEPTGPAVRVLAAEDARFAACDFLFLTGLGEGSFPRLSSPDSLLAEDDRKFLRAAGVSLPDSSGSRETERTLFNTLLTRPAKTLVLSYPAVDEKGRDQLPSSFLAEWQTRNPTIKPDQKRLLIQDYAKEPVYSAAERRIRFADTFADDPTLSPAVVATIRRAKQLAEDRFRGDGFDRFDGQLRPEFLEANRDLFGRNSVFDAGHVFSPTSLESFVACPFKFWLGHVLRVEPLDDPPDEVEKTRRGQAIHRALRKVHETGCEDPAGVCGHFAASVAEHITPSTGPVTAAMWQLEGTRLHRTAARYPAQWNAFREKEAKAGPTPVPRRFEAAFGLPPDPGKDPIPPLVVSVEGIEIRLAGSIDRIDTAELDDGLGIWIIDYKSGRGSYYTRPAVEKMEHLQLSLYALAAERVLFPGQIVRPVGLAYWLVTDTGPKAVTPKDAWPPFRDRLERWVAEVVSHIRTGAFPLAPRSKTCTATCPHGPVCRITQHRGSPKLFDLPLPVAESAEE
jgi:RecB family exonuclease